MALPTQFFRLWLCIPLRRAVWYRYLLWSCMLWSSLDYTFTPALQVHFMRTQCILKNESALSLHTNDHWWRKTKEKLEMLRFWQWAPRNLSRKEYVVARVTGRWLSWVTLKRGTVVGRGGSCFYNNFSDESRVISLAYKRLSKHPPPKTNKQTTRNQKQKKGRA